MDPWTYLMMLSVWLFQAAAHTWNTLKKSTVGWRTQVCVPTYPRRLFPACRLLGHRYVLGLSASAVSGSSHPLFQDPAYRQHFLCLFHNLPSAAIAPKEGDTGVDLTESTSILQALD